MKPSSLFSAVVWQRFRSAGSCELQASTSRRSARRREVSTIMLRSRLKRNPRRASTIRPWSSTILCNRTSNVCASSISMENSGGERGRVKPPPVELDGCAFDHSCAFLFIVRWRIVTERRTDRRSRRRKSPICPRPSCRPVECQSSQRREANWCFRHHRSESSQTTALTVVKITALCLEQKPICNHRTSSELHQSQCWYC